MPLTTDDIVQINQLYAAYNHAIDAGDAEAYAGCFTPDGELRRRDTVLRGPEELGEFARNVLSRRLRHMISNVLVDGDSERDEATGQAYVFVILPQDGAFTIHTAGSYTDRIRRVDGRWVFAERAYVTMT